MKNDIDKFDTSDYPPDNIYKIPLVNKKVLGKMKDENNGVIMFQFIGLRSKMYSIDVPDKITKKIKGVKKAAIRKITFQDFYDCLFNNTILSIKQNLIRSQKHEVYTVEQTKIALSPFDDKRVINYLNTDTLPWGYSI